MNFEGTYVAMVTPFTKDEEIDEEGFRSNINFLIDNGVNGLLAAGTTGESATLSHDEHKKVIEILIDEVDGRVETLAGAGSNSTKEAIDLVKFSEDAGADAGKGDAAQAVLLRQRQAVAVTRDEQIRLALVAATPDRADGVDYMARR